MWVEVRNITPEQLPDWAYPELVDCAKRSDPLLAYYFGQDLIAIVGFIPLGILTGTAYLWMQSTEATFEHKTAVARLGRLTLREVRTRYPRIVGECVAGSRSIKWLEWLGAHMGQPRGRAVPFLIEV